MCCNLPEGERSQNSHLSSLFHPSTSFICVCWVTLCIYSFFFFFFCVLLLRCLDKVVQCFQSFWLTKISCSWFLWSGCFPKPIISDSLKMAAGICVLWSPFSMHVLSCRTEAAAGVRPGYSHSVTLSSNRWDCHCCTSATAWHNMIPVHDQNTRI